MRRLFGRRDYYYVETRLQGEPYLLGPFDSEREAKEKAFAKLSGVLFEIKTFKTDKLSEATRQNKYGRFDESTNGEESIDALRRRVRHKI